MLTFHDLLRFPSFYKNRENTLKSVDVVLVDAQVDGKAMIVTGKTKKYTQTIKIHDFGAFTVHNNVEFECTCESFGFEFANVVFQQGSLFRPKNFLACISSKPREKNKFMVPSGCKHIIKMANIVLSNIHKLSRLAVKQ